MSIGTLSYDEALQELRNLMKHPETITKASIEALVEKVSVQDPVAGSNATTYLYSGRVSDIIGTSDLIAAIGKTGVDTARIIDRTPAAEFLSSTEYRNAVEIAFQNEDSSLLKPENIGELNTTVNNYLYDSKDGPWANRSAELVQTSSGNVDCLVPDAKAGRVWWETEFPNLLNNPNVREINGIPRQELLLVKEICMNKYNYSELEAMDALKQVISYQSRTEMASIKVYLNAENKIASIDVSDLVGGDFDPPRGSYDIKTAAETMNPMAEADFKAQFSSIPELVNRLSAGDSIKNFYDVIRSFEPDDMTIEDVIDFVDSWRKQNGILESVKLAPDQLIKLATDIQGKVAKLSFKAPIDGANIVPYNGKIGDLYAFEVAKALSDSSGGALCYISDIEAGELLNSTAFTDALIRATGNKTLADGLIEGTWKDNVRSPYGAGDVLSINDFVSKHAMLENAHGNVLTFTSGSTPYSVWSLTELPTLLEMTSVTSIDGIPKEDILSAMDKFMKDYGFSRKDALNAVREAIKMKSSMNMSQVDIYLGDTKIVVDSNGVATVKTEILGVDTSKLTGVSEITTPPSGTTNKVSMDEVMGRMSDVEIREKYPTLDELIKRSGSSNSLIGKQTTDIVRIMDETMGRSSGSTNVYDIKSTYPALAEAAELARNSEQYLKVRGTTFKALGVVGGIMIAVDAIDMISQANEAYKSGDTAKGNKIVRDWTFETAGGFASSELFMEAAAPFALAVGACGGPLGIAAGILIELGAGMAGWYVGSELGHAVSDFFGWLFDQAAGALAPRIDPIILDLDGDGIETLSQRDGTYFDLDNNGFAEKSAWVKKDDGFLVFDRNGNGTIDGGRELFGDQTVLNNGNTATNGYQALAEFDENKDGKIDHNDSKFTSLKVWRDLNQDGQSSERELFGLDELGIKAINLTYSNLNSQDGSGNVIMRTGTYEKNDGSTANMGEYLLSRNSSDSIAETHVTITDDIMSLPEITGFGNVYSLREAMVRDSSGELKSLVQAFAAEADVSKRNAMIDKILFKWTGASNIDPASRGGNFDARKLAVLEKFNGRNFVGTNGSNPIVQAVPSLNQAYNQLAETVYSKLLFQTQLSGVFENVRFDWNFETNKLSVDFSQANLVIENKINQNTSEGITLLGEFTRVLKVCNIGNSSEYDQFRQYFVSRNEAYAWAIDSVGKNILKGTDWNDTLNGTASDDALYGGGNDDTLAGNTGNDALYGGDGYDNLSGGDGSDILVGSSGDDKLYGGNGDDLLDGGIGRDYLEGNSGNDTYIFGRGCGQDTVYDFDRTSGITDIIKVAEGLTAKDISVARKGDNLELTINNTTDKLIIKDYFNTSYGEWGWSNSGIWGIQYYQDAYKVEKIQFSNGDFWDIAYIKEAVLKGSEANDSLQGYDENDTISSLGGNDTVYGYGGNDTLNSGDGNDSVFGGDGNDTLNGGLGDDTLQGDNGNDTLIGSSGDDKLYGGSGDDTLNGGVGVDYLEGNSGNDTYIFGRGYGQETVYDLDKTLGNMDVIKISEGITPDEISLTRSGNNLELTIKGGTDKLTVKDYFNTSYGEWGWSANGTWGIQYSKDAYKVEKIQFADDTVWDIVYVKQAVLRGSKSNDIVQGYDVDDSISSLGGNDTIYGNEGNDTLSAGSGTDTVFGGEGNDVLDGGAGDDTLQGENGNDILSGSSGDDKLYGGSGDDILDGGTNVDYLEGSIGNDTYIFARGYGQDTVYDFDKTFSNTDVIKIAEGLTADDIKLTRNGNNLELSIKGTTDKLVVKDYFNTSYGEWGWSSSGVWGIQYFQDAYKVEKIQFVDGTVWDSTYIKELAKNITGTDLVDTLQGYEGNDILSGLGGNDSLYGAGGDDTLSGGTGNDLLQGDTGNDTYIFGRGYGQDTVSDFDKTAGNIDVIKLQEGLTSDDIEILRNGNNLEVKIKGTTDKMTIKDYFNTSYSEWGWSSNGVWGIQYYKDAYKIEKLQFADGTIWDSTYIKDLARNITGTDLGDTLQGYEDNDIISGLSGNDSIYGKDGNDTIDSGEGNDYVEGGNGNDILTGAKGDDKLYGGTGDDVIDGGEGVDYLEGSIGNDTYVFGRGYGQDTIYDFDKTSGNLDVIKIAEGLTADDITLTRNGNNLEISIKNTADKLIVKDYFNTSYGEWGWSSSGTWGIQYSQDAYKVEKIQFADGTTLDIAYIKNAVLLGSEGNDSIQGFDGEDSISGLGGNDTIYGNGGNDTINAGAGNDTVFGGDGNDTLSGGSDDDNLQGENGNDIMNGSSGNDKLYGGAGNDILDGGTDDDYLEGNLGNDTYVFGRGYGQDTVYDLDKTSGNLDVITIADGLTADDISLVRSGNNLELLINGTTDKLLVKDYFNTSYGEWGWSSSGTWGIQYSQDAYKIEKIQFADGTVWDIAYVKQAVLIGSETNDVIQGYDVDDVISSLGGNDTIYGNGGNDTLSAGDGNDTIYGGEGNDTLNGGSGDDTIQGENGNDALNGSIGNDKLYGGAGDDSLDGGSDIDYLEGSIGNDTYVFGRGYGQDTVYDFDKTSNNIDVIKIAEGLTADNIKLTRNGNNLELWIKGTTDKLIVKDYFNTSYGEWGWSSTGVWGIQYSQDAYKVEKIQFADGTTWDTEYVKQAVIMGSENNDVLQGYDVDDTISSLEGNDTVYGNGGNDNLSAGDGNDTLYGGEGNDIINAGLGDDILQGENGNDILSGGTGDDKLYGGTGDDTLDGGLDVDYLEGSTGNDTYIFGKGYGQDTLYDFDKTSGNVDIIRIAEGLTADDILVSRSGNNLELSIKDTTDKLIIKEYFNTAYGEWGWSSSGTWGIQYYQDAYKIEKIQFSDGTTWDQAKIASLANGVSNGVTINGTNNNDVIVGTDLNDALYGVNGNDILDGGKGIDYLEGGTGNDTYVFGKGYGQDSVYDFDRTSGNIDIIKIAEGITSSDIAISRNGNNLELSIKGTKDKLIVKEYFNTSYGEWGWSSTGVWGVQYSPDAYKVEKIQFSDGTIWDIAYINQAALIGSESNDVLQGYDGDDTISSLGGNDTVYGNGGNDVINAGEGNDTVFGGDGNDTLNGGSGIDILQGDGGNDLLNGSSGDDKLYGGSGDDTLDGGKDVDYLEGSIGNDIYVFGKGYGQDTIYDLDRISGNIDIIKIAEGLTTDDINLARNGNNLELIINGTTDKLIIKEYFNTSYGEWGWSSSGVWGIQYSQDAYKVEEIQFVDGTTWDVEYVKQAVMKGYASDDLLQGYDADDTISGLGGNDIIYGYGGNDILNGGNGNDSVFGGDGTDTLTGGEGDDVLQGENGNDILNGSSGDDKLYGGVGDDILDGGADSDYLEGSVGNDTFVFGRYYGQDTVYDLDRTSGNKDVIKIADGVNSDDVLLTRNGNNLELIIKGTTDKLTIKDYFNTTYGEWGWSNSGIWGIQYSQDAYKVEEIQFADGTTWDIAYVKQAVLMGSENSEIIQGYDIDDTISSLGGNDTIYGNGGNDTLNSGDGNDTVFGGDGSDTINGQSGDDTLQGENGNDVLSGGTGDDKLYGGVGEDTFDGGVGVDYLEGNIGNDTYLFGRGYGQDTVYDFDKISGNVDVIKIADGLTVDDIKVTRNANNLEITIKDSTDKLIVKDYFNISYGEWGWSSSGVWGIQYYQDAYKVEKIQFADGTVWDSSYINDLARNITGTDLVDTLQGYDGNDIISGLGGNDSLYGAGGEDTLYGGTGNDLLQGDTGNDTYIFGRDCGQDTVSDFDKTTGNIDVIKLAEGVTANDVTLIRNGNNLELSINGTGDKLVVKDHFNTSYGEWGWSSSGWGTQYYKDAYKVEKIEFSDGTVWDSAYIKDVARYLNGTELSDNIQGYEDNDIIKGLSGDDSIYGNDGNDTIYSGDGNDYVEGGNGNDILYGGNGDDKLYGGAGDDTFDGGKYVDYLEGSTGNDTYVFGRTYGQDTIYDFDKTYGNLDTINIANDLTSDDIILTRSGNDLELKVKDTTDKLIVKDYFNVSNGEDAYKIEKIKFTDGIIWDIDYVKQSVLKGTEGNDLLQGYDGNDTISTFEGNDTIYGYGGNDILNAGDGNDSIFGGDGNDTLNGESGDDLLQGENGNDILNGFSGDDKLYGGAGDDTLDGGADSDYLEGNVGNDTYIFGRGYGQDTIYDLDRISGNMDIIRIAEGLTPDDIILARNGNNLELTIKGTIDKLTVKEYFNTSYGEWGWSSSGTWGIQYSQDAYKVEKIQFADGTTWDVAYVKQSVLMGSENNDVLQGYDIDDVISSFEGNDTIYGNGGNDTLNSGDGNDTVLAGDGNDFLNGESGDDTLQGENGNDILSGGTGDDKLYGGSGEDRLDGGIGVDYLEGNTGNDTYLFGRGYGQDTIYDFDKTAGNIDVIKMADGLTVDDIKVARNGDNLEISIKDTVDKLIVKDYFNSSYGEWGWYSTGWGTQYYPDAYKVEKVQFSDGTIWDATYIKQEAIKGSDADDLLQGYDSDDTINGANGYDTIYGNGGNDTLDGSFGDDVIYGGNGNDKLIGGADYDKLYGEAGDDTLQGDAGNDYLEGGIGNDTYIFRRGIGQDVIYDFDTNINTDVIKMADDITTEDINVKRVGNNLEVCLKGTTDKMIVKDYFTAYSTWNWSSGTIYYNDAYKVENIKFADGSIWDMATIKEKVQHIDGADGDDILTGFDDQINYIKGYAGNDTLTGQSRNDELYGGIGDDKLYGNGGNDAIDGGEGTDYLEGGSGNDTYIFRRGIGQDTISDLDISTNTDVIKMADDITIEDITVKRVGNNLEVCLKGTTDKMIVKDYFTAYSTWDWSSGTIYYNDAYKVENIKFADGTIWNMATIKEKVQHIDGADGDDVLTGFDDQINYIKGYAGNDTITGQSKDDELYGGSGEDKLYGNIGNDLIDGGIGIDYLEGGSGNDTYIFGRGYGEDTIYDLDTASNTDMIKMAADIKSEDISLRRVNNNLEITIKDTSDKLTVKDYFNTYSTWSWWTGTTYYKDATAIENIKFVDGTIWDMTTIKEKVQHIDGTDGDDVLTGFDDQINYIKGYAGNDTITGQSKNDELYGGAGDDNLYGNGGNDLVDSGIGTDYLEGGSGNDTYIFGRGYGQDTIYDLDTTSNIDMIKMAADIKSEDISLRRVNNNLEITIKDTSDKLTVKDYFNTYSTWSWWTGTTYYKDATAIENIKFADGTIWDIVTIKEKVQHIDGADGDDVLTGFDDQINYIKGYAGNDTITGQSKDDELYGGAGDDKLYGNGGNDLIDSGAGIDYLEGGSGNDTYIFGKGYGQDTIYDFDTVTNIDVIKMNDGIKAEDVIVKRVGDNLQFDIKNTDDKLIVKNYFSSYSTWSWWYGTQYYNDAYKVEKIQFADGTVWLGDDIKAKALYSLEGTSIDETINGRNDLGNIIYGHEGNDTINGQGYNDMLYGEAGNDVLNGAAGNDVLYGGLGNDTLNGGIGNDTYEFNEGGGNDIIYDYDTSANNKDTVSIGADLLKLVLTRSGDDLQLSINGNNDSILIKSWYKGIEYQTEAFKSCDGSILQSSQVNQLVQAMSSFTERSGMSWSQGIEEKQQEVKDILSQYWVNSHS